MKTKRASGIKSEAIKWLWPNRVPQGRVTILEGDPGTGKSGLTMYMAARVSNGGEWPDAGKCEEGSVIIANVEDIDSSVIVPRLSASGANLDRVWLIELDDPEVEPLIIPTNVPKLREHVKHINSTGPRVSLIICDPLDAFASDQTDLNRSQHARKALRSLEVIATEFGCAVIVVRHLSKSRGRTANYRGLGSISLVGAARSAITVARDPSDDGRSLLASVKGNWSVAPTSLAFRTVPFAYRNDTNELVTTSSIQWEGEVRVTADDLAGMDDAFLRPGEMEDARRFLETELAGGAMIGHKALQAAAKVQGISAEALWRAKRLVGVTAEKRAEEWFWYLSKSMTEGVDFETSNN